MKITDALKLLQSNPSDLVRYWEHNAMLLVQLYGDLQKTAMHIQSELKSDPYAGLAELIDQAVIDEKRIIGEYSKRRREWINKNLVK